MGWKSTKIEFTLKKWAVITLIIYYKHSAKIHSYEFMLCFNGFIVTYNKINNHLKNIKLDRHVSRNASASDPFGFSVDLNIFFSLTSLNLMTLAIMRI